MDISTTCLGAAGDMKTHAITMEKNSTPQITNSFGLKLPEGRIFFILAMWMPDRFP
jgi:hypothetical protein